MGCFEVRLERQQHGRFLIRIAQEVLTQPEGTLHVRPDADQEDQRPRTTNQARRLGVQKDQM